METTADQKEIDNFAAMSNSWWDEHGPMAPLHRFTPIRVDYILDSIKRLQTSDPMADKAKPLSGLRVLDIGCGGGLLAEPMARLGANVTGIDAAAPAVEAAKIHAEQQGLDIDYRCIMSEDLASECAKKNHQFDVIYASEVIEHVSDRKLFARAIASMLAPGGTIVITTINRTLPALLFAKFALEYVVKLVPAGTHDPAKFVRPAELRAEFAACGIALDDIVGFAPRPSALAFGSRSSSGGFMRVSSLTINYGASGGWA